MKINYISLLENKLITYKERYPEKPVLIFIKLIWWSINYGIKNVFKKKYVQNTKDKNKLYIGIAVGGGLGDILISANYIQYFKKYISPCKVQIDCYTGNLYSADAVFINNPLIDNLFKNKYHQATKSYDLYMSIIEPFPNVIQVNENKIKALCPQLMELVNIYLKNEKLIGKTIKYSPKNNTAAYIASLIQNRNRVQLNDIEGYLGIKSDIDFVPNIGVSEIETLKKYELDNVKYITINRSVGELNKFWDSMKMWPLEYWCELVKKIKENFSEYKIIQLGHSTERSPIISGLDFSLVGKTSFEEAKVILKNSILHIDGEGGLVHLRHALKGGKSIVLFGPTSPDFYGYSENINVSTKCCPHWCDWVTDTWQTHCLNKNYHICLKSVTPNVVLEQVFKVLSKAGAANEKK